MNRPVLVTGAAGFVGGHLLNRLVSDGAAVVGWYRPGTPEPVAREGVEWMAVELLDRAAVAQAMSVVRPTAVYHLAAAAHVAQSFQFTADTYQINVLATDHLLSAVRRTSPHARVLVAGSATIYRPQPHPLAEDDDLAPASPYATSKLAQEMLASRVCREDGMDVVIARSFNHTGPGQEPSYVASGIARQIARIEAGRQEPTLRLGNLEPKRDLSDVRDVVRAYVGMVERALPGRPYNICSGRAMTIRALVDTFVTHARVAVTLVQDPALFRPNDTPLLVGDHARLTAETGWMPEIPFERTVDDLLEDWRARLRAE